MKKFLSFIFVAFIVLTGLFSTNVMKNNFVDANAMTSSQIVTYQSEILAEYAQFSSREPGSDGENLAVQYIKDKLDEICASDSKFAPVDSASTIDGIQKFSFTSIIDGLNRTSQNLIYYYESSEQTDNKVIIACNYDSVAYSYDMFEYLTVESESINGSAGSVAVLLSIAKQLGSLNLPFDVEIIFFGAGESNNAGSEFYSKGILPETKEKILSMINIDGVAVGENLYFYIDEVNTKFNSFVDGTVSQKGIKKVDTVHLGKILYDYETELGLDYSHIAMNSDNLTFMKQGIVSINLFAGDYDEGIVYGKSEYAGKDAITYTKNDNLEYISKTYGGDEVSKNLYTTFDAITTLLTNSGFADECLAAKGQTDAFYLVFGNQKFVAYLCAVVLIVIIAVIIYLHYKLSLKSYTANIEPEFLSTVISISEHIDETFKDETVPKAVSQVLAHDIKKDKTIKNKKKKNKED